MAKYQTGYAVQYQRRSDASWHVHSVWAGQDVASQLAADLERSGAYGSIVGAPVRIRPATCIDGDWCVEDDT